MNIVERKVELLTATPYEVALNIVERAGRTCYKSEDKIKDGSAAGFIKGLIKSGHEGIIEFFDVTFKIVCDRQTSHQIVRHRLANYAQTSQRYVNYSNDKWGNNIPFIVPYNMTNELYDAWRASCVTAESAYFVMLEKGAKPEVARSVLPNSTATEICMKMNMRELRHFLKLRCDSHAQDDIRDIAFKMLGLVYKEYPVFVEDILETYAIDYRNFKCKEMYENEDFSHMPSYVNP